MIPTAAEIAEARIAARIAARYERERAEREAKWAAMTDEDILRLRLEESRGDIDPLTRAFIGATVPMWIDQMRPWRPERRLLKARELADVIAFEQCSAALCDPEARGTGKKAGGLAKAFNAIAQGLALIAFCPGGVVFGGHHFEARS